MYTRTESDSYLLLSALIARPFRARRPILTRRAAIAVQAIEFLLFLLQLLLGIYTQLPALAGLGYAGRGDWTGL